MSALALPFAARFAPRGTVRAAGPRASIAGSRGGLRALVLVLMGACSLKVDRGALEAACDAGGCGPIDTCTSPTCCRGCWDGTRCWPGDQPARCGTGGEACRACEGEANACQAGICATTTGLLGVSASGRHTCAADDGKNLWCWGDNAFGQLGVEGPSLDRPKITATGEWIDVAAGGGERAHSCAIHYQGSLWCWGDNSRGQLGLGDTGTPVFRATMVDKAGWRSVAAGAEMTCAVRDDGGLYCWGANDDSQLGFSGGGTARPTNVGFERDWRAVSARGAHACAVKETGALYCWGRNDSGQLGRVDVALGGRGVQPGQVGSGYVQVSAGTRHTCAIRTDGSLRCWGDSRAGQLGVGDAGDGKPDVFSTPMPVNPGARWSVVAAGGAHTCAIEEGGALRCWGANEEGQLGTGAVGTNAPVPVPVAAERTWRRVTAGERHTCAEARDGAFACWGSGMLGQTGTGQQTSSVPTLVTWPDR